MSLISIVRDAALLVGLSRPDTVASSTDVTEQQLLALANEAGYELARFHDWGVLSVAGSLTGDGTSTSFTLPADFDRFGQGQKVILDGGVGTIANGPISSQEIASFRARSPISVAFVFWRRGNTIEINPALASGRKAIFEYQSRNWARTAAGAPISEFSSDTDTSVLNEQLIKLGLVWLWKRFRGLDYGHEYERWRQQVQLVAARDGALIPVAAGPALTNLPEPVTPDTILVTGG